MGRYRNGGKNNNLLSYHTLRTISLPEKVKCYSCERFYGHPSFSDNQLNIAKTEVYIHGTKANYNIKCRRCSGGQVVEIECTKCGVTKGLNEFAKVQRANADTATCFRCTEKHLALEPINHVPRNITSNRMPTNSVPIGGIPISGIPMNGVPINSTSINATAINSMPFNSMPFNVTPFSGSITGGVPINNTPTDLTPAGDVDATTEPVVTEDKATATWGDVTTIYPASTVTGDNDSDEGGNKTTSVVSLDDGVLTGSNTSADDISTGATAHIPWQSNNSTPSPVFNALSYGNPRGFRPSPRPSERRFPKIRAYKPTVEELKEMGQYYGSDTESESEDDEDEDEYGGCDFSDDDDPDAEYP